MPGSTEIYKIRLARLDEITRLREIEDRAGKMFAGLGLIDESLDEGVPLENLKESIDMKRAWVATEVGDSPVGFVIASELDGTSYIEEMDVIPEFGRRGIGARLLEHVCRWAYRQGYKAATLSTFRNVPWNGPFYRKHGFRILKADEWSPGMTAIRVKETGLGLRVGSRVFMTRDLTTDAEAKPVVGPV